MNKNKHIITLISLLVAFAHSVVGVTITTFGNVDLPVFTVDATFTDFTVTPGASSLTVSGVDNNSLAGSFAAIDLSSFQGNQIVLSGSVTTNPLTSLTITLFDGSFNSATYVAGSFSALASGQSALNFSSAQPLFDWSSVSALSVTGGGGGSAVTATFTGLSIVPEPSAYAAIAGFLALGWVMVRRRC